MTFIIIGDNDGNKNTLGGINKLKDAIDNDDKHLFLLIFSNTCGPCMATKPIWDELEKEFNDSNKNIVVARIEGNEFDKLPFKKDMGESPSGVPSFRYIHNGKIEDNDELDRTVAGFTNWIESKSTNQSGGKRRMRRNKTQKTQKKRQGGKRRKSSKKSKKRRTSRRTSRR